jgi:hypothetical protein
MNNKKLKIGMAAFGAVALMMLGLSTPARVGAGTWVDVQNDDTCASGSGGTGSGGSGDCVCWSGSGGGGSGSGGGGFVPPDLCGEDQVVTILPSGAGPCIDVTMACSQVLLVSCSSTTTVVDVKAGARLCDPNGQSLCYVIACPADDEPPPDADCDGIPDDLDQCDDQGKDGECGFAPPDCVTWNPQTGCWDDKDTDGDGISDCVDPCPLEGKIGSAYPPPSIQHPLDGLVYCKEWIDGCWVDLNSDGDDFMNCNDACPYENGGPFSENGCYETP